MSDNQSWEDKEKAALELINAASLLTFEKDVELLLFRRPIFNQKISQILNDHLFAKTFVKKNISVITTSRIAQAIYKVDIAPSRIDLARLAEEWIEEKNAYTHIDDFVLNKLKSLIKPSFKIEPRDVVLYGFGRIGRLAARLLVQLPSKQLRLKAIVTRNNKAEALYKRASLLRKDSIHGKMDGTVKVDEENEALIINGQSVKMISANHPSDIDYTKYNISNALVIDNTGVWKDEKGLGLHLQAKGVEKVLLTAPAKGNIPNIVHGINHATVDRDKDKIFSAASCTTNAIVPALKIVMDEYGIENGHIESIHSYTNDQNLVDNYHKKYRRGRGAALNMVITETGAGKAVSKAIPELEGKLTANAVRVPTPNVSLAILKLNLSKPTTKEDINDLFKRASLYGNLVEQIDFSLSNELVSTDVVGNPNALEFDSNATIVNQTGKNVVLYVWYDNEFGYTNQVVRLAKYISKVNRLRYY